MKDVEIKDRGAIARDVLSQKYGLRRITWNQVPTPIKQNAVYPILPPHKSPADISSVHTIKVV